MKHYVPAVRVGGWTGNLEILAPGDPVPSLKGFAGLLVAGGADIHPKNWDPTEPLHPSCQTDEARDALEVPLAREAWELGLPILGICRGEQVLNVAMGGSLVQDIPSRYGCAPDAHLSGSPDVPKVHHEVTLDPQSRLAALIGATTFSVNSRHHQALDRVAPCFKVVGWPADDPGIIEAIEATDEKRWVFGVQWHPENLVGLQDSAGQAARRIFEAFVQAAQRHG